jgi:Flp pilus assembly protein TadG
MKRVRGDGGGRAADDRGAVLVEFALVFTFLCTLVFGVVEFGMAWQDKLTVETATRSGVRVGSNLGKDSQADYNLLLGVKSALTDVGMSNVNYVIVYKSSNLNGTIPSTCPVTGTPASVSGVCNVYTGAQLTALASTQFGGTSGKLDAAWPPANRVNLQSSGPDYLGVWIKVTHPYITKLFGNSTSIVDSAVMRLEPA